MLKNKRLLALLMAVLMIFACLFTACSNGAEPEATAGGGSENTDTNAPKESGDASKDTKTLEDHVDFVVDVEEGRDIRVLQFTDVQTVSSDQKRYPERASDSSSADTFTGYKRYLGQIIERYSPDLIILTGDNVYGEFDDNGERFLELIAFLDSFEIPWAPVFGNHDNESNMGVDWQCQQLESAEYCLFKQRELTGNGNYTIGLTQGGELKRVFYMLDSNGSAYMSKASLANGHGKTTVGFGQDQIDWYSKSMKELKKAYPSVKLSMAFHIQLSVFADAYAKYGYDSSTVLDNPINLDNIEAARETGDFGYIGRALKNSWDSDHKVWNTIKKYGVDSVFVGHEHCNSASVTYQGVRLTYGQKSSTYDRYNKDENGNPIMGGTYINVSERDGSISDTGILLYDWELGYEPETDYEDTFYGMCEKYTETELDFDGKEFDANVTTSGISTEKATKMTSTASLEKGFYGGVYHGSFDRCVSVGVKFAERVNVDSLKGIFVKMYVADYDIQDGKDPVLRIYNATDNSILSGTSFDGLGGVRDEWVYVNILDLVKNAENIVIDGVLQPFSLVYRCYGNSAADVYFDSITLFSEGDPYEFEAPDEPLEREYEVYRGELCYKYSISEFEGKTGIVNGATSIFVPVSADSYSMKFTFSSEMLFGNIRFYGYTDESKVEDGICVTVESTAITIDKATVVKSLVNGNTYDVEIGFVDLDCENTAYVFVKVNGELVLWELVDTYGMTAGNFAIVSDRASNSFTIG